MAGRRGQGWRVACPTRFQIEAVECGAAALGIVLAHHGLHVPAADLRRECGVSRDGSKASNVVKAARRFGMEAKGLKRELESLKDVDCPYIVFWNFNHFLVVEGFRKGRVFLNDPATGPRTVSMEEFDACYTGVILTFTPGPEFQRGGRPPAVWRGLFRRLSGHGGALAATLATGFFLAATGIAAPAFTQVFVDEILIEGRKGWLTPFLLGMALLAVLEGLSTWVQLAAFRRLQIRLKVAMSGRFLWQLLHLPIGYYAQRFAGEIATRQGLNDSVAGFLTGQLGRTATALVTMGFFGAIMYFYDPVLAGVGIGFAAVNFLAIRYVSRRRVDDNLRLMTEVGKTGGMAIAGLQSIETLKASAQEGEFYERWIGQYAKMLDVQQDLGRTNVRIGVLPTFLSNVSTAMILVVGGFRVMEGHLSIGMLIAFQSYMNSFNKPVGDLIGLGSGIQDMKGNLQRLDDVLENEPDRVAIQPARTSDLGPGTPIQLRGEVEIRDLTFGYSPIDAPILRGFGLHARPGQRIAIVGGSGSGKSTVAKLIAGFYDPWSGEIRFDGKPAAEVPRVVRSHSIALVEQDVFLFAGTVFENLTLWDETVPFADVVRACEDAEVHETIQSLAGAYAAELQEGAGNLSGGQRQRLELARALVGHPSILILDEPTSALDAETEARVMRNLRRRGVTMVVIAHRLSTIRDCDEIVVLKYGEVVQRGTHDQLMGEGGEYVRLVRSEAAALSGEAAA